MQTRYKTVLVVFVGLLIVPQITLAAWWNPFSWFKKTSPAVQQSQPQSHKDEANQDSSATKLNPNQDKTQHPVTPKDFKPAVSLNKARLENKNSLAQESLKLTNKKIIALVKPAVVYLETDSGSGSGMIFDRSGFILTNAHVVAGTSQVKTILSDGRSFIGAVIGRDEIKDLAVVQIQANGLSYVTFGNSDSVEQGDQIFALGYPFGLEGDVSFKEGTISRRVNFNGASYLEISAEIHPGNSGGPLVDETGKVIGINSLAVGSGSTGALRFAIPINDAKSLIPELENGRTVFKPRVIVHEPTPQVPVPTQPPQQPYVPPQISPAPYVPPATYIPPTYAPIPVTPPASVPVTPPPPKEDTLTIVDSTFNTIGNKNSVEVTNLLLHITDNIEVWAAPFEKTLAMTLIVSPKSGSQILVTKNITLHHINLPQVRMEIASGTRPDILARGEGFDVDMPLSLTLPPDSGAQITVAGFDALYLFYLNNNRSTRSRDGFVTIELKAVTTSPHINVKIAAPNGFYTLHLD